jgi:hypothetical protein
VEEGVLARAPVRQFTVVLPAGAAGIHLKKMGEASLFQGLKEESFGQGTAANVAQTDEQNGGFLFHGRLSSNRAKFARFAVRDQITPNSLPTRVKAAKA